MSFAATDIDRHVRVGERPDEMHEDVQHPAGARRGAPEPLGLGTTHLGQQQERPAHDAGRIRVSLHCLNVSLIVRLPWKCI